MLMGRRTRGRAERGQALVELALVLPLFLMVLFGIIILGVGVFYQQQLTNAARDAARFAVIHSASSDCPTVSWRDPDPLAAPGGVIYRCDPPPTWPQMTAYSRGRLVGMATNDVKISACWSGYWTKNGDGTWGSADAPPPNATTSTYFRGCTIGGVDPRTDAASLSCPATTSSADDMASDLASSTGLSANQVTVYACYEWQPPLAGFLLIPQTIHLRAVITQGLEYQQ
jgi:TadE-like protein